MNNQTQQIPQGLDPTAFLLTKAIKATESAGSKDPYNVTGDDKTSLGAYQIQQSNWKPWAKQYLGDENAPMNEENQNKLAYSRVKDLLDQGHSQTEVASIWNSGKPNPNDTGTGFNAKLNVAYDVPGYVNKVKQNYINIQQQFTPTSQNGQSQQPNQSSVVAPSQSSDTLLQSAGKAVMNAPEDAWNFAKGVFQAFNPLNTLNTLSEIPGAWKEAVAANQGNAGQTVTNALNATPGAAATTLVPQGVRQLATGDFAGAKKSFVENPVSNIAPVIATAMGIKSGLKGEVAPVEEVVNKTEVTKAAERQGIPVTAGTATGNPLVQGMEAFASKSGKGITDIVNAGIEGMNRVSSDLIKSTGASADLTDIGSKISDAVTKTTAEVKKVNDSLYETFSERAGGLPADVSRTMTTLQNIIDQKMKIGEKTDLQYFKDKLDALQKQVETGTNKYRIEPADFNTLKEIRTAIGEKRKNWGDTFTKTNQKQLGAIYGALSEDMKATLKGAGPMGQSLFEAFGKAENYYKDSLVNLSKQQIGTIQKFANAGAYDKIFDSIVKPSASADTIPRLMDVIGPEGQASMQAGLLDRIISNAQDIEGNFKMNGITKAMEKFGEDKLSAILKPEQVSVLKDLETISNAMEHGRKIANKHVSLLSFEGGVRGLGLFGVEDLLSGNVAGFIAKMTPYLGEKLISKIITSKFGQDLLSNSSKFAKLKESITPSATTKMVGATGATAYNSTR